MMKLVQFHHGKWQYIEECVQFKKALINLHK